MYGFTDHEINRQHREQIRREVAVARLEKTARANREGGAGLVRSLGWELARYAGLLGKRLGNTN